MPPPLFIPTEIVIQIASFVAADDAHRQQALYSCCLVSRNWYSASIALLYERPRFVSGKSFASFTQTICPPIAARKPKLNLGGFVRRLDLGNLVHHSSNSLTARLLGRVKENLEVFVAPTKSFSTNSLPAVSKCQHLRVLDLALAGGDPIDFLTFKKALTNLSRLTTLHFPRSITLPTFCDASSAIPWPPRLRHLQISGHIPCTSGLSSFGWPSNLTSLTLSHCISLDPATVCVLLSSPHLSTTLKRLTISPSNRLLSHLSIDTILGFLPNLLHLRVPGDLVEDSFFELLTHLSPVALEVLELGSPAVEARLNFATVALMGALERGLVNLRSLGFMVCYCSDERVEEDEQIDDILHRREGKASTLVGNNDDDDDYDYDYAYDDYDGGGGSGGGYPVGVYYM